MQRGGAEPDTGCPPIQKPGYTLNVLGWNPAADMLAKLTTVSTQLKDFEALDAGGTCTAKNT